MTAGRVSACKNAARSQMCGKQTKIEPGPSLQSDAQISHRDPVNSGLRLPHQKRMQLKKQAQRSKKRRRERATRKPMVGTRRIHYNGMWWRRGIGHDGETKSKHLMCARRSWKKTDRKWIKDAKCTKFVKVANGMSLE